MSDTSCVTTTQKNPWSSAAALGARTFVVYGIIETAFLVVFRWLVQPLDGYRPLDVGFALVCVGLYAALGLALGLITHAVRNFVFQSRHADITRHDPWPGIVGVVVILLGGVLASYTHDHEVVDIGYSLFLFALAALTLTVGFTRRPRGFGFLLGPQTAWISAVVLMLPSTTATFSETAREFTVGGIIVAGTAALWIVHRVRMRRADGSEPPAPLPHPARALLIDCAVALALCALAGRLQPTVSADRAFSPSTAPADRPNVVMLILDTVTAEHLSLYGYLRDTSPILGEIASGSTLFTNALSTSNYTLSSTASIFTGRYPSEHGARYWDDFGDAPLPRSTPVLAEFLTDAGYATAGVASNTLFLSTEYGLSRGFQYYDARSPAIMLPRLFPRFSLRVLLHHTAASVPRLMPLTKEFRAADEINASAMGVLDDPAFRSGPFFLFVNYMDAHEPNVPPAAFTRRFATGQPADDYDAAIQFVDTQVGALVAHLKAIGAYDNTLLIIAGDHGESFGDHGDWLHPSSLHESQIHVPLIIKWPRQRAGAIVDALASGVDLMPTVLGAIGQTPTHVSGRDLAAPIEATRAIFAEDFYGSGADGTPSEAVMVGSLKLIQHPDGRREVFDRLRDRAEQHNLYRGDDPAQVALARTLRDGLHRTHVEPPRGEPNRTSIERLRALGYVR